MAQGAAVDASPAGASTEPRELTDKEAYEIQQYDKIVRFTDAVLHGSHPTIKAPDAARPPPQRPLGPAGTTVQTPQAQDARQGGLRSPRATDAKNRKHRVANPPAAGAATPLAAAKPAGRAEINPVLLEKSGELVRAEITLQRQRLERALRDEVDQRRLAKNAQSELHSDLDLSDVLAKALLLVPASAAPPPAGEEPATNDDAAIPDDVAGA
ncbi:hypothetical protein CDD83_8835 [Cordyceps sp. RAO-2017]|nr:hypothetical protein CDD83_8835 [Cordyceps sp. RAO-2017]